MLISLVEKIFTKVEPTKSNFYLSFAEGRTDKVSYRVAWLPKKYSPRTFKLFCILFLRSVACVG